MSKDDHAKRLLFSVTIKDCQVETFRAGGKGGQNQNKVESGVRVRHLPSGAKGEARDSRDQPVNKRNAFLRMVNSPAFQRWHKLEINKHLGLDAPTIKHGSGTNAFGAKRRRTYDFPDRQVKDHITGHVRHDIENVLNGDIDSFIQASLKAA